MLLELFLGVIAAILFPFLWWIGQTVKYKSIAQIPGPVPLPILGNVLHFLNYEDVLYTILKLLDKYGPVCRIWFGCSPVLMVKDLELAELILRSSTYSIKADMYRYIKPWLKNSMLTATGEMWQRQKKLMSLCMNIKYQEKYLSIFNSSSDVFVDILSAKADGHTYDIAPLISSYTLDVIVETAMGAKLNCQRQPHNEYAEALHFMATNLMERSVSAWKCNDFLFMFSKAYREQKKACNILNDFGTRIIGKRRKQLLGNKEDNDDMDGKKPQFLDIVLNTTVNGKSLPEQQIRDDLSSFVFAGHDTTASALQLLFHQLSNNQEVQNKIVDELKEIYGNDKSRVCTMEDTYRMTYMERVIKESMRYNAPVPFIARILEQDVNYKNTILPKGLNLIFCMYALHRNPDVYDNPDVFDPDRFISEDSIKPYSFLPFSIGPRNCKGQKYAFTELKVTVAKLLRNFEFLPAGPGSELKLLPCLVLRSSNGINVRIKHRDF